MRILISLLLLSLLSGCGSSPVVVVPDQFNTHQLPGLIYRDSLLSRDAVATIAGIPVEKITMQTAIIDTDSSHHSRLFSWPNGQTKVILTQDKKQLTLPAFSSLGVGYIHETDQVAFQEKYESKDALKKRIDKLVNDAATDPDIAIAEARYLAGEAKGQSFKKMEKIGDLAYWETPVQALHVLVNGYAFTITTNVTSPDDALDKAVQLAQLIFKTCSTVNQ